MATHDYIIANGTGAAVRADINLALQAIVSLNSGAAEPATMYAYQLWADTSTGLLKIRNSANSAWVTLRQLDGDFSIVAAEDGLQATPSLTFTNDLNTGIFRPGTDSLAIVTGATRAITITSTQAVGIQTANPSTALHVAGNARVGADDTSDAHLQIGKGATGNRNSYIDIVGDTTYTDYGLRFIRNNTGANATSEIKHRGTGNLNFTTQEAGAIVFNTTNSPRVTILPAGNVGIGTSSPGDVLDTAAGNYRGISIKCATTAHRPTLSFLNTADSLAAYIQATGSSLAFGTMGTDYGGHTPRMTLTSTGLGIGTTSPGAPLSVNGNAIIGPEAGTRLAVNLTENDKVELQVIDSTSTARALALTVGTTEAARIDSSGRLLVGTSTTGSALPGQADQKFQVAGGTDGGIVMSTFSADPYASNLEFRKSRSASIGTKTIVQSGDTLGKFYYCGADGTNFIPAAAIEAFVDGTPGANDMPGRLVFSTTADGASSPTERMRINQAGGTYAVSTDSIVITLSSTQAAGTTNYLIDGKHSGTAGSVASGTRSFRVFTNGNVENTNNSYTGLSDIKLKENIVDANSQWDDIKALRPVNYNFKEGQTHTQIGLVAQEVELVSPGLVSESPDRDEDGNDLGTVTKSVNYSVLYMKAVKALQEAMERIETLEAKVAALESA